MFILCCAQHFPQYNHQHMTFLCNNRLLRMFFSSISLSFYGKTTQFGVWRATKIKNTIQISIKELSKTLQNEDQQTFVFHNPLLYLTRESIMVVCSEFTGSVWRVKAIDTQLADCSKPFPLYILSSCSVQEVLWRLAAGGVTGVHSSKGVLHPNKLGRGCGRFLFGVGHNCPCTPIIRASIERSHMSSDTCNVYTNTQHSCYN